MAKVKVWSGSAGNTDLITPEASTAVRVDNMDEIPTSDTLIRTLLWYDVRYLVQEDHTEVPRTPVPIALTLTVINGDGSPPDPPADPAPILRTLLSATATPAFGRLEGTSEIQDRVWTGGTAGLPVESDAARNGHLYAFVGQVVMDLEPAEGSSSDIGFWQLAPYVVFWRTAFLHIHDTEA